jgi:hypothetical protein
MKTGNSWYETHQAACEQFSSNDAWGMFFTQPVQRLGSSSEDHGLCLCRAYVIITAVPDPCWGQLVLTYDGHLFTIQNSVSCLLNTAIDKN